MRTCFKRLDANQSGTMSKEDFDMIAARFIEVGGLTGVAAEAIRDYYTNQIWKIYFKLPNSDESTCDAFIENLKHNGKKAILATTNDIHARYFDNMDHEHKGRVGLDAFTKYFYIMGIDAAFAAESFKAIDVNHDGFISRAEFIQAGNDFFGGEHPHKTSDLFFGPLVD